MLNAVSGYVVGFSREEQLFVGDHTGERVAQSSRLTTGNWYHFAVTYNDGNVQIYINGKTDGKGSSTFVDDTISEVLLVYFEAGGDYLNGTLDEIRISSVARSKDWIATSFDNQNDPAAFYKLGKEEKHECLNDITPLPDLIINSSDISFIAESPTEGDSVCMTATIGNTGASAANDFTVSFFTGTTLIGNDTISVNENSASLATITWTAAMAGEHSIKVIADYEDKIEESNETNNEVSKTLIVKEKTVYISGGGSGRTPRLTVEFGMKVGHSDTPICY